MGKGGRGGGNRANNSRSNAMNPNNPAYHAGVINRGNQMNPSHSAYWSSRGGSPWGGGVYGGPGGRDLFPDHREGSDHFSVPGAPAKDPYPSADLPRATPRIPFQVPHEFQRAVMAYRRGAGDRDIVAGLPTFRQADGAHSYLAVILGSQLVVFVRSGDAEPAVLLERQSEQVQFVDKFPQGTDVNGDGAPEILVHFASWGNGFSASPQVLFSFDKGSGHTLASCVRELRDLDGDGIMEAVIEDNRWEFIHGLPHAHGVSVPMVFGWRDGAYVYRSPSYASFYKAEIAKAQLCLAQARAASDAEEDKEYRYTSAVVNLALTLVHAGDVDTALGHIQSLLYRHAGGEEHRRCRRWIVDDFRSGESVRKIVASASLPPGLTNGDRLLYTRSGSTPHAPVR